MTARKDKNEIKDKYLTSIFLKRNPITKKSYELNAKSYFLNYGPYIPKSRDIRILDIGCGMGHFLYALTINGYHNFIGIDISSQMINFIKNLNKPDLSYVFKIISKKVEKAETFDFLGNYEGRFDLIVANDVIEHIEKRRVLDFFKLVRKKLKDNGVFIAKTANMTNLVSNMLLYDDFTHEYGFTNLSLTQVYLLAGFKNVKIKQFITKKPRLITKIFRKLTLKFISELFGVREIKSWSPLIFGIGVKNLK
ncbi:MAG: class I SAM-dependent methyltransferase [Candidatus Helarchaeota archaeon]|nr:class I SAM-dependent methyltransferase [Candidatus Helarchaeota archaeon]